MRGDDGLTATELAVVIIAVSFAVFVVVYVFGKP